MAFWPGVADAVDRAISWVTPFWSFRSTTATTEGPPGGGRMTAFVGGTSVRGLANRNSDWVEQPETTSRATKTDNRRRARPAFRRILGCEPDRTSMRAARPANGC